MYEQTSQPTTRHEFESKLIAKTWQDEAFKQELISDPKAVYARELGQEIPESLKIQVLEESANTVYLVLPRKPEVASVEGELSDEALEVVAGGDWGIVSSSWFVVTSTPHLEAL
ncbi:NHLP leader peptide family RiPP precursor [Nostoc sp. UIC 10607]|uniref:NHLP leader peptide family RiPP precursor n=1 Tax=Nostoc sp. UIC 10607 TaxID=3045935 RepID=UPI00399F71FB